MSAISANQQLATELGLSYNRESGVVAGIRNGYHIAFIMQNNLRQAIVPASNGIGQMPEKEVLKQAYKENKKVLSNPFAQGYRAAYSIPSAISDKGKLERSAAAAVVLTGFFKTNCLRDCDGLSGRPDESSCCYVSGGLRFLTRDKYDTERNHTQSSFNEQSGKRGNPTVDIVGASIGSFAGFFIMALTGQLSFVLPWTGLAMGVCVAGSYELLPGKPDTVGLVCSILIMIGMTYLDDQLDWATTIARAYEADVSDASPIVNEVVKANELLPVYHRNLALYYFAMLYDAFPAIYGLMKNRQLLNVFYLVGSKVHESVIYISSENGTDSE